MRYTLNVLMSGCLFSGAVCLLSTVLAAADVPAAVTEGAVAAMPSLKGCAADFVVVDKGNSDLPEQFTYRFGGNGTGGPLTFLGADGKEISGRRAIYAYSGVNGASVTLRVIEVRPDRKQKTDVFTLTFTSETSGTFTAGATGGASGAFVVSSGGEATPNGQGATFPGTPPGGQPPQMPQLPPGWHPSQLPQLPPGAMPTPAQVSPVKVPQDLVGKVMRMSKGASNPWVKAASGRSFSFRTPTELDAYDDEGRKMDGIRVAYAYTPGGNGTAQLDLVLQLGGGQKERVTYALRFLDAKSGVYSGDASGAFTLESGSPAGAKPAASGAADRLREPKTFRLYQATVEDKCWFPAINPFGTLYMNSRATRNHPTIAVGDTGAMFFGLRFDQSLNATGREEELVWIKAALVLPDEVSKFGDALDTVLKAQVRPAERTDLVTLEFCTLEAFHDGKQVFLVVTPRGAIPFHPSSFTPSTSTGELQQYTQTEIKALRALLAKYGK